uniref:(northern house mosquito) hypothetical protein n=1 Tax=Culex pipiens TaxID=7175 RepID=A0A8D8GN22_CULPI
MTMNDEQGLPPEVECLLRHRSHPVTEHKFPNPNTQNSLFPPSKFHIEAGKLNQIHTFHQENTPEMHEITAPKVEEIELFTTTAARNNNFPKPTVPLFVCVC